MIPLKNEHQQFLPDEEQWKLILKDIHRDNIPIEIHRKSRGIAELYANNVPASLYVKHSYDALKRSLLSYIEEFEAICHKTLENNLKKFKILQDHELIIKLGLEQITEELAFLNLRPISQVMHMLNTLVFRITMNFLNFVKSAKKSYLLNFQRKRQSKQSLTSLCPDCLTNRQQGLLKDLKRKLNLNKTQLLQVQQIQSQNHPYDNSRKTDRQKQSEIINQLAKVKHQTKENLRLQEERQSAWIQKQKKLPKKDFMSSSNTVADDIFMNEKQTYIKQINDLLKGRQVKETTDANAYLYLVRELMEFPHLDKLHEETYAKEAEKITEKIQGELLENFMTTLSQPLRQVLRKVLSNKYMNEATKQHTNQLFVKKVDKVSVEVQTPPIEFEKKLKSVQKQLQKKTYQLTLVRQKKEKIQTKYFEKYEQQKENQKQLHQNFLTIQDLKQQIQYIMEEKDALQEKFKNEMSQQNNTMKKCEETYLKIISDQKVVFEDKLKEYREKINQDFQEKIVKLKQEKEGEEEINSIKYQSELKLRVQNSISPSFETIQQKSNGIEDSKEIINADNEIISANSQEKQEQHKQLSDYLQTKGQINEVQNLQYIHSSKESSIRSIDVMIKFNQKNQFENQKNFEPQNFCFNQKNEQLIYNEKSQPFLKGRDQFYKSQYRIKRITGKQYSEDQKPNRLLGIETEKCSPKKHFSTRKFRKVNKQVQFSFIKNQRPQRYITLGHTQNLYNNQNSTKNLSFDQVQKLNQTTELYNQSYKKKPTLKSALKLKNITIEEDHELLRLNRNNSKAKAASKNSHKSSCKTTKQMKKNTNQTSQIHMKSSQISLENSQSYESFGHFKFQEENQKEQEIWRPEFQEKQYEIETIKSIIEREFKYLKLTGVIEKVHNLQINEQKNLRQKVLSVAKKAAISDGKPPSAKSKDRFIKSQETLKSILSRSMNKFSPVNGQTTDLKTKRQMQTLAQSYYNKINEVETFSNPTNDDLQLFGGKQNAQKIEIQNFNQENSVLIVKNTLNPGEDMRLIEYFEKLFDLNRQKYTMYTSFLKYPTSYLNGNISKVVKHSNKALMSSNKNFQSDMQLLRGTIKKIIQIHEKQHQSKCLHLQKFLKKIGYYRYMVNL